ncbi:MAG: flippase-like domain-containing protein [Bacteroidetes Order II. Incertae sedis bacterium]|nr:flippase-like domain-containing protein [Bacteroidetes Order II. bacterium]
MKQKLTYLLSFALALVLMVLALRGVSFEQLWMSLRDAEYRWLGPTVLVMVLSHWFRAWRWKLMLDHLPEARAESRVTTFRFPLYAIFISYMVNYVLPRVGEIVRVGSVARKERLSFSGVLGTVVADRTSDVIVLLLGFLSLIPLAHDKLLATYLRYFSPLIAWAVSGYGLLFWTLLAFAFGFAFWMARRYVRAGEGRFLRIWKGFKAGFVSYLQTPKQIQMLLSTVLIWASYTMMVLFSAYLLHLDDVVSWGIQDSWVLLVIGSLTSMIPTPGGVGSYHVIIRWAMVSLWGFSNENAIAFAIVTHTAQMIVYTLLGFVSLFLQGETIFGLFQYTAPLKSDTTS